MIVFDLVVFKTLEVDRMAARRLQGSIYKEVYVQEMRLV